MAKGKNGNKKSKTQKSGKLKMNSTKQVQRQNMPYAVSTVIPQNGTYFKVNGGKYPDSIRVTGREYVGSVVVPGGAVVGQILRKDWLSPSSNMLQGTRLALFSRMYEKYVFKRVRFHYTPAIGLSTAGNLVFSFDKDPNDIDPPQGEIGIRYFMSKQNAMQVPIWQPAEFEIKLTDDQKFYYTNETGDSDDRLSYQGVLFTAITSGNTGTVGSLYITYDIELFDPTLDVPLEYAFALNQPSQTLSQTSGAAWNNIMATATNVVSTDGIVAVTDPSNGNKGFELAQGEYILEQFSRAVSVASNWLPPVIQNLTPGEIATSAALIAASAAAGGHMYRSDRLIVPTGGARIFGYLLTTTVGDSNLVRIIKSLPGVTA